MTTATEPVGVLVRRWRERRRRSRLDVSLAAELSARHLSCIETGRANPSRDMIRRLCDELDVPLRERNAFYLAAGFAPAHPERAFADLAELESFPAPEGRDGVPPASPGLAHARRADGAVHADDLVVPPRLATEQGELSLLYTTTVFGSPRDVTLDESAIATFHPADRATATLLRAALSGGPSGRDAAESGVEGGRGRHDLTR
ncbi:multiprotein-bridging factor 1 family protein [Streptomyces sp. NPDC056503]|uniref:helix-turn-helix domain-containing protein n=1 Tax=Streptomyces sp. NPDC056503 TaxID=3345842 RepID=UPI0036B721E2